jgi:cytosine/adenosine deaminase-related metal-dependent hydrolase
MLLEARQALLVQRIRKGVTATTAMSVLELATLGGAAVLGRDDIGCLEPGKAADLAIFDTRELALAGGAVHDPVGALIFCAPQRRAHTVFVNGRVVVEEGRLVGADEDELIGRANAIATAMVAAASRQTGRDYSRPRESEVH